MQWEMYRSNDDIKLHFYDNQKMFIQSRVIRYCCYLMTLPFERILHRKANYINVLE